MTISRLPDMPDYLDSPWHLSGMRTWLRARRPLTEWSSAMELCKPAGLWLRKLGENCGLSQRQLAAKVDGGKFYYHLTT